MHGIYSLISSIYETHTVYTTYFMEYDPLKRGRIPTPPQLKKFTCDVDPLQLKMESCKYHLPESDIPITTSSLAMHSCDHDLFLVRCSLQYVWGVSFFLEYLSWVQGG